jgi:hypothetical protein
MIELVNGDANSMEDLRILIFFKFIFLNLFLVSDFSHYCKDMNLYKAANDMCINHVNEKY